MTELSEIKTMADLRREIDSLDRELVCLLGRRSAMIDRAATLKAAAGIPARIDARVEAVISNVRSAAVKADLDADLAERLWRDLIEWSISREEVVLG